MNRGLSVIHTYRLLFKERELTDHEIFKAYALGWCVELLQACFLVADDVMDDSVTRRGKDSKLVGFISGDCRCSMPHPFSLKPFNLIKLLINFFFLWSKWLPIEFSYNLLTQF
jgi:hypothetical protein